MSYGVSIFVRNVAEPLQQPALTVWGGAPKSRPAPKPPAPPASAPIPADMPGLPGAAAAARAQHNTCQLHPRHPPRRRRQQHTTTHNRAFANQHDLVSNAFGKSSAKHPFRRSCKAKHVSSAPSQCKANHTTSPSGAHRSIASAQFVGSLVAATAFWKKDSPFILRKEATRLPAGAPPGIGCW